MARTEATLKNCALTQQVDEEYWLDAEVGSALAAARAGDALPLGQHVVARLHQADIVAEEAYIILHDKDEREIYDHASGAMTMEPKPEHVHMVIRFAKGSGGTLAQIAAAIGIEQQYVEKPQRGRYAYDNMLSYLTHIKYADKYQYDPAEVKTIMGRDYMDVWSERYGSWKKGAAVVKTDQAAENVEAIRDRILEGALTREEVLLTDHLFDVYGRHRAMLDDAFAVAGQRRAMRAAKRLSNGEFETTVLFVTGHAGTGKTRWAMTAVNALIERAAKQGQHWQCYRAATSNPLDDWNGEEVILLDDLRASAMTATEWLLLLDPFNASPAAARYRNKAAVAPRLIVITSSIPPIEFFFYARQRGDADEALDQFMRRLTSVVRVIDLDEVNDGRRYEVALVRRGSTRSESLVVPGRDGLARRETFSLAYRPAVVERATAERATDAVVSLVADRCRDLAVISPDDAAYVSYVEVLNSWPTEEPTVPDEPPSPEQVAETLTALGLTIVGEVVPRPEPVPWTDPRDPWGGPGAVPGLRIS